MCRAFAGCREVGNSLANLCLSPVSRLVIVTPQTSLPCSLLICQGCKTDRLLALDSTSTNMMHFKVSYLARRFIIITLHKDARNALALALDLKLLLLLHLTFDPHLSLLCIHVSPVVP